MSDEEIVETLARFEDYYLIEPPEEDGTHGFSLRNGGTLNRYPWRGSEEEAWADSPEYILSRDALAKVFAKLNDDQLNHVKNDLYMSFHKPTDPPFFAWLLTCPPRTLAQAIAEVLREKP